MYEIKKFIPQLAIDTEYFHRAFASPCTMYCKTKGAVGAVCTEHLTVQLAITVGA